jgi:hypothetical protein
MYYDDEAVRSRRGGFARRTADSARPAPVPTEIRERQLKT